MEDKLEHSFFYGLKRGNNALFLSKMISLNLNYAKNPEYLKEDLKELITDIQEFKKQMIVYNKCLDEIEHE